MTGLDPERLLLHDDFVRALARSLVANAADAEDVAQQSFTEALHRGPQRAGPLRAWLTGLVRHVARRLRRSERRRATRERAAARPGVVPSVEAVLEREALRRRVVAAVVALPEPYRTTVLLRYFEGLAPRAIAHRLGIPAETARTRSRRALELLRERLDAQHGSRVAWSIALAPIAELRAVAPLAATSPAWLTTVILMTAKTKIAIASLVLVAATMTLLLWPREPAPAAARVADAAGEPSGPPASATLEPAAERGLVASSQPASPAASVESTGGLLVRARWAEERALAEGIQFRLFSSVHPRPTLTQRAATTANDGTCRFESLRPGKYLLQAERSRSVVTVTIEPGSTRELDYELPLANDVTGVVVDRHGAPFPDGEIWIGCMGSADEHWCVARSGVDGRFSLRGVAPVRWVAARAPGLAQSRAHALVQERGPRREIKLVLGAPAGGIAGRVLDSGGKPLAGALVVAGPEGQQIWLDDGTGAVIAPTHGRTDGEGRFAFASLTPGKTPVSVGAVGHATQHLQVDVQAGITQPLEVRLEPGVTLAGRVRDPAGAPLKDVTIRAGEVHLLSSRTHTDDLGEYRLADLAPSFTVLAETKDRGKAAEQLRGEPGTTLRWDPVLQPGQHLTGRVVDARGQPVVGCNVTVGAGPNDSVTGFARTDARGEFTVPDCDGHRYRVDAEPSEFHRVTLEGVDPRAGPVVLRVPDRPRPSAKIVGRLVNEHGDVLHEASFRVQSFQFRGVAQNKRKSNDPFEIGPLPAGEWLVFVDVPHRPILHLGPRVLADAETWDLGTLRVGAPGGLVVQLERGTGQLPDGLMLTLLQAGWPRTEAIRFEAGRAHVEALPPGRFTLAVRTEGYDSTQLPLEVESGKTTRVVLPVRAARTCTIRIRDARERPDNTAHATVRSAEGRVLIDQLVSIQIPSERELRVGLPPGEHRVEVSTHDARASGILRVGENAEAPVLELVLR